MGGMALALWLAAAGAAPASPPGSLPDVSAVCVSCRLDPSPFLQDLAGEEWQELEAGSILARSRTSGVWRRPRAAMILAHPADEVWAVLTDFESWPRFMPHLERSRLLRVEGPHRWVEHRYRILFHHLEHTTRYRTSPAEGRLTWSLEPGSNHDIRSSTGSWQLVRIDGGRATLLRYQAAIDPGRRLPKPIERLLLERSLRGMLASLRREVDARYGSSERGAPAAVGTGSAGSDR